MSSDWGSNLFCNESFYQTTVSLKDILPKAIYLTLLLPRLMLPLCSALPFLSTALTSTLLTSIHHFFKNQLPFQVLLDPVLHLCVTMYSIHVFNSNHTSPNSTLLWIHQAINPPFTTKIIIPWHTVCAERARQHLCLRRGSSRWACLSWRHSLSSRRKRCCSWFECQGQCRNYSFVQGRQRCHGRRAR